MDIRAAQSASRARQRSRVGEADCQPCGAVRAGVTSDYNVTFNEVSFSDTVQPGTTNGVAFDGELGFDGILPPDAADADDCYVVPLTIRGLDVRFRLAIGGSEVASDSKCVTLPTAFGPSEFTADLEYEAPSSPGTYDLVLIAEGAGTGIELGTFESTIEVPGNGDTGPIVELFPSMIDVNRVGGEIEVSAEWFVENGNVDEGWEVSGSVDVEVDGDRVTGSTWGTFIPELRGELFEDSWTLPVGAGDEVVVRISMEQPTTDTRVLSAQLPRPNLAIANLTSEGFRDGGQGFVDVLWDVETSEADSLDVGGSVIVTAGGRNIAQDSWTGTAERTNPAAFSRTFQVDAEDNTDVEIEVQMDEPVGDLATTSATVPGAEDPPPDPCPDGILLPDPRGGQACVSLLALAAAAGGGTLLLVLIAASGGGGENSQQRQ